MNRIPKISLHFRNTKQQIGIIEIKTNGVHFSYNFHFNKTVGFITHIFILLASKNTKCLYSPPGDSFIATTGVYL